MRRRTARPFGQSTSYARMLSMLMALVVLGFFYTRLKDPTLWQFILSDSASAQEPEAPIRNPPEDPEILIPGPNDLDEDSAREMKELLEFAVDRSKLLSREMPAYWKMIDWSRTQSIHTLEKRALTNVPFRDYWEQPDEYRGKLIRLRLHVRMVTKYEPKHRTDVPTVYEAWGWTDDSLSFPYVVVFSDSPPGLPIGKDIRAEMVFTGYFLKTMAYTAYDNARWAPLLVGRARLVESSASSTSSSIDSSTWPILGVGVALAIAASIYASKRRKKQIPKAILPDDLSSTESASIDPKDDAPSSADAINFDFLNSHRPDQEAHAASSSSKSQD